MAHVDLEESDMNLDFMETKCGHVLGMLGCISEAGG